MVVEKVFAVIAESTRRDLLEALAQESKSVGQLVDELGVSQPTVSKHLRVLREAGVVTMRAQGQKRFYLINTEPLALVSSWLETLGAGGAARTSEEPAVSAAPEPASADAPVTAPAPVPEAEPEPEVEVPVVAARPEPVAEPVPAVKPAPEPTAEPMPEPVLEPELIPAALVAAPAAAAAAWSADQSAASGTAKEAASTAIVPLDSLQAGVVQSNEHDGGVPGQISRSVGRAANKAADLLANLPALPTFKRRKN